jgi:hypothetical protein
LVRWKKVAIGIVHQIEQQIRRATVTKAVQELKCAYAPVEDTVASLSIHIFRSITWHRGYDLQAMFHQKFGEPFETGFKENSEITPVDDGFDLG